MLEYKVLFPEVKKKVAFLFGDHISLSHPVPDIINGIRAEKFFLYPVASNVQRTRPFGLLTVSAESGTVLSYQNCHLSDFVDTEQHPFEVKISYELPKKIGIKEFKLEQSLLEKMYEVVREIAFTDSFTLQQQQVLRKYWVVFEKAVPVALMPYYQAMGRNFFEWGVNYV